MTTESLIPSGKSGRLQCSPRPRSEPAQLAVQGRGLIPNEFPTEFSRFKRGFGLDLFDMRAGPVYNTVALSGINVERLTMNLPDQPLHFQNQAEWRTWLEENHAREKEAWLVILKNHITRPGVFYEEAVEEAVCFGWIDGIMKSVDAEIYYLRFSPRKRGSIWSVSNQKRVEWLIAQGRMTEAGMAKVKEAKENGEWEAAIRREDISSLPDDLRDALGGNASAQVNFDRLSPSQKKQFLYWIASAKTEKTRQRRIQKTVEMAANNERFGG